VIVPSQYGDTEIIADAERTPSGRDVHCVRALWLGISAASSSRLVVPVFDMAR
jgi:hypothetical protein